MLLTFEFESVEEAAEFLKGLTAGRQPAEVSAPPVPAAGAVEPSKDSAPTPKKRGSKPKETALESTPDAAPVVGRPAPELDAEKIKAASDKLAPGAIITLEDCREALAVLFEAKGRDVCKGVLKQFDAAKVGDLKPEKYADFIRACQAA